MAKESVDSGLSNYPPQLSLPSLRQFPASGQPSRQQNQLLSPSTERNLAQTYAVVNAVDYRMSTGSGINSNNNNNGQNPPPNTAASATPLFPRYPPQLQQAPPRVHFGEPKSRQRFRHPSESTRMRAPPPFVRSFSSKAFELPDGLSPPPVLRPSSPQREFVYHHRDTLLDKGIQCEPETAVAQRSQTHSNPLLSALLAAANAVNSPSATVDMDPTLRRKTQFRAGALPYWSDSEVNAYDSPDTFNVAPQSSLGMVSGSKAYPSASVVAAAATAAAMALAAVQSTSRGPGTKSLDPPLGAPMSRASLQLEELTPEAATMRSLTGQFAETSLYSRFPASIDQRKSVNSDATPLQKADVYGNTAVDTTQMTPQAPSTTSPLDKNNQRINIGTHYFHETSGSQVRYPLNEENNLIQPSHLLADSPAGRIQERCPPGVGLTIPRTQIPSNLNSSQFNLLSSEPYPSPTQTHRPLISTQSPAHDVSSSRYRPHPHLDSGGGEGVDGGIGRGLLVINVIAGSGLKTTQMPLRDLYCVLETDCVRKARSMIRTSSDYFEWDEVFEVEVEDSRFLSFLIYQWDARTRHRLCFYGGIDLTALAQRHLATRSGREEEGMEEPEDECQPLTSPLIARSGLRFEKIALQLEPRGVLYLQIGFLPMVALYARRDLSASYDAAFFGVSLDELMYRDRMLANLGVVSDSVVPLMIRKCVEEVDRRGTEVVGVYRLSGSVWTKLQVRDLFTRTAEKIAQGLVKRNEKAIRGALAGLDLSADAVPDIHAITATLKDFFRELPEPLFTNALYPMVYEATQVAGPGGSHMGTKLILNILDCLPTSNQEVLLYLLDHLKRITSKSMVNKMNSHNLAVCLAPCLLHPSPAATRDMDSGLLDPNKMVSVLECILDIWP